MAVYFKTTSAQALLKAFDAKIAQSESRGKITTWEKSTDGNYYTHRATEWNKKAWLKPQVEINQLIFNIIKPQNLNITSIVYAYYHGHLIETFLNHFDQSLSESVASALPRSGDIVS